MILPLQLPNFQLLFQWRLVPGTWLPTSALYLCNSNIALGNRQKYLLCSPSNKQIFFYSSLFFFRFSEIFLQASEKQNIYRSHNPNFSFERSGSSVREKILKSSQNKIHLLQIRSCVKVVSCLVQWDLISVVKFESDVSLKICFQFAAELDFSVVTKLTSKSMK